MLLYIMHVFIPIPHFTIYGYFRFTLPRFHKKYLLTAKKYRIYLRTWYHRDIFSVNKVFLLCIVSVCIFIVFFFLHIRFYGLSFLPAARLFRRFISAHIFLCRLYRSETVAHAANVPQQRSIGQYFLFL